MDTTVFSDINWLAVLVAALAYFVVGALWYAPLFGKTWVKHHKIDVNDPEMKKGVAGTFVSSFLLMIVTCIGLAILISRMELTELMSGVKLGLLTGIFFSMTSISITYLYLKKPAALHFIEGLYHVVGQIVAAIIICLWQ